MKGMGFYDEDFIKIKNDEELISESVRRIIMTNPGERVGQPFFGVGLKGFLFELGDDIIINEIRNNILEQITTYEPRVNFNDVYLEKSEDGHTLYIKISYRRIDDTEGDSRIIEFSANLEV